ncbi:hypothetical protein P3L10_015425 [Capsicum annuum]
MNGWGKLHPTFINNDRQVSLYMLDVVADGSRPLLRINVIPGSPTIPPTQTTIEEHDLYENESLDAHPMDSEDHSMELKDPIFSEEEGEEWELGEQTNHTFFDGTNFKVNQTFSSKKELKLLLDIAAVRNSFGYTTLKSCSKFLEVKYVCPSCALMLQAKKYECTDIFVICKYVSDHSCDVEYTTRCHKKISSKVIVSLCVNMGFAHMRKVIAVDNTHLYGKYEGVLLSTVAQNTENHIYPIAFCIVDKENDASWMFFFEKLKSIVVDEPDLCFISDWHKSIANGIVK